MALGLGSCSQEAPFTTDSTGGTGSVLSSALAVEVRNVTPTTRAVKNGVPEPEDFKVEFYKSGTTENPAKKYDSYAAMPDIVVLPAGKYYVKTTYGGMYDNGSNAAFNAPHYEGKSEEFEVEIDKIVDNIEPIICKMANVRVAVKFDEVLANAMSPDSKVSVHVGTSGTVLDFNKNSKEDGFFAFAEGSQTLAATFIGEVEDENVNETKTIENVKAGNYYIITFKLHTADAADPGDIDPSEGGSFIVDASVTFKDLNKEEDYNDDANPDPSIDQDEYLEDDMRPQEGEIPGSGDQPGKDDPNENPGEDDNPNDEPKKEPVITASDGIDLNKVNQVADLSQCVLYINCENGIKEFMVDIQSEELVESLQDLASWPDGKLNLVNPGEKESFLNQLLGEENVGPEIVGREKMEFNITQFLNMLSAFDGIHNFVVDVTDLKGLRQTATLRLEVKN